MTTGSHRPNKSAGGYGFGLLDGEGPSMLPTLGLTKYKNTDLAINHSNPYTVHGKTEMMLIHKERERELRGFNKMEKDAMHIA